MKYAKFLIVVVILIFFSMSEEASANVIFDGTFGAADHINSMNSFTGSNDWGNAYACANPLSSISVVDAKTLPGERTGYALLTIHNPGYSCGSANNHVQLSKRLYFPSNGIYYQGFSLMLASDYPSSVGSYWRKFGFGNSGTFNPSPPNNNYGIGLAPHGKDLDIEMLIAQTWYNNPLIMKDNEIVKGAWYDFVIGGKLSWNPDGWIKVWVRKPGEAGYTLKFEKYNIKTTAPLSVDPKASQFYREIRIGQYNEFNTPKSKVYYMNPKIGTTFDDVKYTGSSTPPTDSKPPEISITCPDSGTYTSTTISLAGTATDDVGISKVEVKVNNGNWQLLTGTVSPSWSISGLNLADGANTITARATDTSGKTAETSISVTYSNTAPPSGTVLWDGSFHGNERINQIGTSFDNNAFSDPSGNYKSGSCLRQWNEFSTVDASTIGDGSRSGIAGKFYIGIPGDDYVCGSANQHLQLYANADNVAMSGTGVKWYGYSLYLVPPFNPGTSTLALGAALSAYPFDDRYYHSAVWLQRYGGSGKLGALLGYNGLLDQSSFPDFTTGYTGMWLDILIKANWQADNTGYYEFYIKKPSDSAPRLMKSAYGVRTLYNPGIVSDPADTKIIMKVGGYGTNGNTQSITWYVLNPKIGTTQASVEYGSSGNPAPDCTPPLPVPCTDTCSSLGFKCGTRNICGVSKTCGTCTLPEVCSHKGKCRDPDDCIPCVYCKRFEKWKIVCNMADEFCTANNYPTSFCTEQKLGCESKVDELIAKCHDMSCEENCDEFYDNYDE